ncbi:rhomboid family intramembrane serine protease [Dysgonomonas macrotermitis]|uniref:Membrane associated serine protease, rhomboid family n=1 Tax=Dysgonomonas macrotermitis TaxID=1346286 RepID=A0A1M5D8R9_9BACT|nr:rhomboid family intramembrane serine protease [Dysgonomonas macrotermitis]SHF63344.1 Membrane associated serine protease, rhomboid family [Dysgonomonas macrotermitis]
MNQSNRGFFSSVSPVTLNLIIINVIIWLSQTLFLSRGIDISSYLGLHYYTSDSFYPHQLITYMFLHDPRGITHVLFNMFAVFMFGRTLEMVWGGKRFLFYYILTGLGAGIANMLVMFFRIKYAEMQLSPEMVTDVYVKGATLIEKGLTYNEPAMARLNELLYISNIGCTVGASGAVFGILVAFGMLFPNVELMIIPIPIPIKAKFFVIGYGVIELLLGVWDKAGDNIAHFAHLGGLITGLILVLYWKKTNKKNGRFY